MLCATEDLVSGLAREGLKETVSERLLKVTSNIDMARYLSVDLDLPRSTSHLSFWTKERNVARRMESIISIRWILHRGCWRCGYMAPEEKRYSRKIVSQYCSECDPDHGVSPRRMERWRSNRIRRDLGLTNNSPPECSSPHQPLSPPRVVNSGTPMRSTDNLKLRYFL
ncbi:unnamed protein product [Parnassius apollo]|uniref:(apollo) hypothetical protein n=1 Tax=Parnassius apollo TaxID=110799 RepID=A0A8S3VYM0_PARAO|nr:unnamed protein product [Parnassius apollo]